VGRPAGPNRPSVSQSVSVPGKPSGAPNLTDGRSGVPPLRDAWTSILGPQKSSPTEPPCRFLPFDGIGVAPSVGWKSSAFGTICFAVEVESTVTRPLPKRVGPFDWQSPLLPGFLLDGMAIAVQVLETHTTAKPIWAIGLDGGVPTRRWRRESTHTVQWRTC
jgi:hypothetical protein